jgi:hypothetical protein
VPLQVSFIIIHHHSQLIYLFFLIIFKVSGDKGRMNQSGPSPQTPNSLQRSNSMMNDFPNVNQQSNESNVQFSPHDNFGINNPQQQQPPQPNQQQQMNKMNPFMDQKPHDVSLKSQQNFNFNISQLNLLVFL